MIKLPFPLQHNAILTFSALNIKVWLKLPNEVLSVNEAGLNNSGVRYEGNVIDSSTTGARYKFPATITVSDRGWLKFNSGMEGDFVLEQIYTSAWASLDQVVGQRFSGLLLPIRRSSPSDWV